MRKIKAFLLVFSFLLFPLTAYAAPEDQKVYDNAQLFSPEELQTLEDMCNQYGETSQVDIVIITTKDLGGKTPKSYLEDFYDEKGFGYNNEFGDTAMVLLKTDPGHVEIQGYGQCEYYISDNRIESILNYIYPSLKNKNFYQAMEKFISQVNYYMEDEPESDYTHTEEDNQAYENVRNNKTKSGPLFQIGNQITLAIGIGAATVLLMAFGSGGRNTVNSSTYLEHGNSRVLARQDIYLRTTTTKRRKPKNNNSSGGGGSSRGGGGVSSGGHSHSGGGRSF